MSSAVAPGADEGAHGIKDLLRRAFLIEDSPLYHRISNFIVCLIVLSVISIALETVPGFYDRYRLLFELSEAAVVTIFTIEYAANIYVAPDRRKYIFGIWGIIDLLAILPSILLLFDFRSAKLVRILRVVRVLRILRVLKLARLARRKMREREHDPLHTLRMDLQIYFLALFAALSIFASLAYFAEHNVENTLFTSIPQAMWWGIVTLTTTGYGDMYPATVMGRVFAGFTMITGIALFGLLMNVVGKAMMTSLFGHADEQGQAADPAGSGLSSLPPYMQAGVGLHSCSCGQVLNPRWQMCPMCGTPASASLPSQAPTTDQPRGSA